MPTPLHRRPGVTVDQIKAKRQRLVDTLKSPEHDARVPTREYGNHDPRIAPFPACTCGAPARLEQTEDGKWDARCSSCAKRISHPQKHDWAACLEWCQLNMQQMSYQDLPLFDIKHRDPASAKARMVPIHEDLILRSQIATLDLSINQRTWKQAAEQKAPGIEHLEKLQAYTAWAKFALRLIKVANEAQQLDETCEPSQLPSSPSPAS